MSLCIATRMPLHGLLRSAALPRWGHRGRTFSAPGWVDPWPDPAWQLSQCLGGSQEQGARPDSRLVHIDPCSREGDALEMAQDLSGAQARPYPPIHCIRAPMGAGAQRLCPRGRDKPPSIHPQVTRSKQAHASHSWSRSIPSGRSQQTALHRAFASTLAVKCQQTLLMHTDLTDERQEGERRQREGPKVTPPLGGNAGASTWARISPTPMHQQGAFQLECIIAAGRGPRQPRPLRPRADWLHHKDMGFVPLTFSPCEVLSSPASP